MLMIVSKYGIESLAYIRRIPLIRALAVQTQRESVQSLLHAGISCEPETVVLVKDGDPRILLLLHIVLYHRCGLVVVAASDIDNVLIPRPPEKHGASKWSKKRSARFLRNRNCCLARRGTHLANERVDIILFHQPPSVRSCWLWLVHIVVCYELKLVPFNTTGLVGLVECSKNPIPHPYSQRFCPSRQSTALSKRNCRLA
mmetsp:Transcript_6272/g.17360  ORF Transcript_6272/g.17360 Transcript_6272/m.17360 type:complete len:200 (-) Transcript_6272:249-848(-)